MRFLKGLEEPPDNSYFILLSPIRRSLLVTVRSRSQTYPFAAADAGGNAHSSVNDELALRWSRGSIGTLKTLDLDSAARTARSRAGFSRDCRHARRTSNFGT